jgi:hypothetical protein
MTTALSVPPAAATTAINQPVMALDCRTRAARLSRKLSNERLPEDKELFSGRCAYALFEMHRCDLLCSELLSLMFVRVMRGCECRVVTSRRKKTATMVESELCFVFGCENDPSSDSTD